MRTKLIRKELKASELIGKTHDGKHIYLFDYLPNSSVMREIGRLRELSFRQVQEGTGRALDIDRYDRYYRHLILWDEEELEIIGSYRIGEAAKILKKYGESGLYTHSLFEFTPALISKLEHAIELGRSFIQPRYQGKHALDYLWYGIGAYLYQHPEVRYMLGPVSLSTALPEPIQKTIASFYSRLLGSCEVLATPRLPFAWEESENVIDALEVSSDEEYKQAYAILKEKLGQAGAKVPILYKQYVELCNHGGCQFLGFNVDPNFSNCVDGLILVHIEAIKEKKYQRYIQSHAAMTKNIVSI